jgi:phosphate transport system substrate-binding protein
VKHKWQLAALAMAAAGSLLLSACGSDNSGTGAASSASSVQCGGKQALKASGSSAQANAMTRFVAAYEAACPGQTLNYTSNGSGAGVSEFLGKQTDFGGSDSPLDAAKGEVDKAKTRCDGNPAWDLPVVFGPIAVTYNLAGVDGLALDGPTLGKIFSGGITVWNDPGIAALNSGKTLPATKIVVVFRNDESGTTDNFQKYLTAASNGSWTKGSGKAFAGGVGQGAKGNEGTSAQIKSTAGAITYNEWSFAKAQNLAMARIVNAGGGDPVDLTAANVSKAIEGVTVKGSGNDLVLDLNSLYTTKTPGAYPIALATYEIVCSKYTDAQVSKAIEGVTVKGNGNDLVLDLNSLYTTKTPGAYPIALATYEIVCSKYTDAQVSKAIKAFLTVTLTDGQKGLDTAGYIPLPSSFVSKLQTAVAAIA